MLTIRKGKRTGGAATYLNYVVPERVHNVHRQGGCVDAAVLRGEEECRGCRTSEAAIVQTHTTKLLAHTYFILIKATKALA